MIIATLIAGCTPDVATTEGAGGATTAAGATVSSAVTSTSTVGSTTSSASTTASATSGSTSASSTGSGGPTCSDAAACSPDGDPGCSIACPTGDVCDCDGDGYGSTAPGCPDPAMPDCFDCNAAAMPDQTMFFTKNRGDGSFDYDCDATQELLYSDTCPSSNPCSAGKAFTEAPKCGHTGDLHDCEGLLLMCMKTAVSVPDVVQPCR